MSHEILDPAIHKPSRRQILRRIGGGSLLALGIWSMWRQPARASEEHGEAAPPKGQVFSFSALLATIIFEGRPMGLLTIVPEIVIENDAYTEFQMRRFTLQDRFVLGIGTYATTGFDPRGKIDILRLKRMLQYETDKLMGPKKGTVFITSAYIAKRS
jgi:hypothetical protein